MYKDYLTIIPHPIAMIQIKKRLKDPNYTLSQFKDEMNRLFDNAKIYNDEESWVHNAATDMQEFFQKMYAEEVPKVASTSASSAGPPPPLPQQQGVPHGLPVIKGWSGEGSGSGASTPMYKQQEKVKVPTKLKITLGTGRKVKNVKDSEEEEEDSASDGDDDDY
jgi:ATP-dependent helicase STH1/SNF2